MGTGKGAAGGGGGAGVHSCFLRYFFLMFNFDFKGFIMRILSIIEIFFCDFVATEICCFDFGSFLCKVFS